MDVAISRAPAAPRGQAGARTLVDIFSSSVARWPDQVALDAGERRLTFRQLAEEAQQLAERLGAAGAGRGDRVGIRVPSGTAELYIAVLGALTGWDCLRARRFRRPGGQG